MKKNSYDYKYGLLIFCILMGTFLLKLNYIMEYVTYTDEILSASVADSIWKNGVPILPSGDIYNRSILHHYLLSIPIGLWGIEYLPMRINSIIFSVITILTIYLLGSTVSNRLVALGAAFILSISSLFNQFSLSGRMYITYGAFYCLTLYFFYEGFIKNRFHAKWLTIVFLSAAMLTSEAGASLGPILIFAFFICGQPYRFKNKTFYPACIVWCVLAWFVLAYVPPSAYQPFTVHSGAPEPSTINLNMPVREIVANIIYPWRALDKSLPLSIPFFLIMTIFVSIKGELRKHYPLVVLLPALIIGSFVTYKIQYRIIISWLPVYILASCQFIETLIRWTKEARTTNKPWKNFGVMLGAYIILGAPIAYMNKVNTPSGVWNYIGQAFGYHDTRAGQNLEPSYRYLKSHIEPDDKIIVTTVEYGLFFLGPNHDYYYLRQKKTDNTDGSKFVSFGKDTEPYYGKPLIDSIEKLDELLSSARVPVWIVTDYKTATSVSSELIEVINKNFKIVFDDNQLNRTKIYLREQGKIDAT